MSGERREVRATLDFLRLAYYPAANVARRRDPQLAAHYCKLMCERDHTHIQANCAIARKLSARTWAVLQTGEPYQPRDLDGHPIDETAAVALAVPTDPTEHRRRNRATNPRRCRLAN